MLSITYSIIDAIEDQEGGYNKDKYCPVLYRVFDGIFSKNKNFCILFTKQTRRENMVQLSIVFTRKCIDSIWKFC